MTQERLLWELQSLVQEVYTLQKKEELKPLAARLRELQLNIKNGEAELLRLNRQIEETEKIIVQKEENINMKMESVKKGKEKLYSAKGSSLKELLSLQQSLAKTEEEVQKAETDYWETQKKLEELKKAVRQTKEIIRTFKLEYNEGVKRYNAEKQQVELKIAELLLKQDKIKEELNPETLKLFLAKEKQFPGNPVATFKAGICTGCHISIPSHLALNIRVGKSFYCCDNCGRILINSR